MINDIDKDIHKKYGQLNIKNNTQKINNIEINNNIKINNSVDFFKNKKFTPYCDTTYNLFQSNVNNIEPYNEYLNVNKYCNK